MSKDDITNHSRRSFLKSSSLVLLSNLFFNDPASKVLAEALGLDQSDSDNNFTCELFRSADLLSLKYFFFNARIKGKKIIPQGGELLLYIKIPSQHRANELLELIPNDRSDYKQMKSFLAKRSWLGFRLADKKKNKLKFKGKSLLNWAKHFEMLTVDHFAKKDNKFYSNYGKALLNIKSEFQKQRSEDILENKPVLLHNLNGKTSSQPVTTFEIPYKIVLSPIAAPAEDPKQDLRVLGNHIFISNNLLKQHYIRKNKDSSQVTIYSIWENRLMFINKLDELSEPRFKAVRSFCPESGIDEGVEIFPAPINREEIKDLTSLPEFDRDIKVDSFRISAIGASTNFNYENNNPLNSSLVAYNEKIKYGSTINGSVTFRAIDVITGLKLRISIVSDKLFKDGYAFDAKLYRVDFAEPEKNYEVPVVVSRTSYKKIKPDFSKGNTSTYFYPHEIEPNSNAYLVGKSVNKPVFDSQGNVICDNLLEFDYIGFDKNNVRKEFRSKIVFIPAETYTITSGTYRYTDSLGRPGQKSAGQTVSIPDISELNPALEETNVLNPRPDCLPPLIQKYIFKQSKVFSTSGTTKLSKTLDYLRRFFERFRSCFAISIESELTFAKIDKLKELEPDSIISKNSTNSTFYTQNVLFVPISNKTLTGPDFFFDDFPIVPSLWDASVRISQIDQIRGKSIFYKVKYYEIYKNSGLELDIPTKENKAFIFFELPSPIENFFSENYKASGATTNPGIKITHISALDNSIAYNETHNYSSTKSLNKSGIEVVSNVPASSIFREMKAEILGISLISIIQDSLPVEDIPFFKYAKQIEQSVQRLQELEKEFRTVVQGWKAEYENLVAKVRDLKADFERAEEYVRLLSKNNVAEWLDTLVEVSGTKNMYNAQRKVLESGIKAFSDYRKENLDIISREINKKLDLTLQLNAVYTLNNIETTKKLFDIIDVYNNLNPNAKFTDQFLKEVTKSRFLKAIQDNPNIDNITKVYQDLLLRANNFEGIYHVYNQALLQGFKEALEFSASFAKGLEEKLSKQVSATIHDLSLEIQNVLIRLSEHFAVDTLRKYIFGVYNLATVYTHYYRIYSALRKDYYLELGNQLGLDLKDDLNNSIKNIEKILLGELKQQIKYIKQNTNFPPAFKDLENQFNNLHNKLASLELNAFENFEESSKLIEGDIENLTNEFTNLTLDIHKAYSTAIKELDTYRNLYRNQEKLISNFLEEKLKNVVKELTTKKEQLINSVRGSKEYKELKSIVEETEIFIKRINELSKQKLDYSFETKKFQKASLGNVIEFIPENNITELRVNVSYEIELNVTSLNNPPSIGRQSHLTDSSLNNFKLGMLQLIYIDFERVRFISGSDVKDDFKVRIRNVEFAGFLGFFSAFQDYLKSLSDNLVFDINATGARIGYGISIPDITSGAFNFFNLTLSGLLTLPFQPDKSLELSFGIGNELNKFGLTVSGIFGGQGYFNIIAEPRRGIIEMVAVLEFGAIFNLDLKVAKGTAYLVGGIYIRRYNGNFELRAYILCVGRLRILALFSASVTFYLGLHGNGSVLHGVCQVTVSYRFSPFFKVSATFSMEKTLAGTKSKSTENSDYKTLLSSDFINPGNIEIIDTNIYNGRFYQNESVFIFIAVKPEDPIPQALTDGNKISLKRVSEGNIHQFTYDFSSDTLVGEHDIHIVVGDKFLRKTISVLVTDSAKCLSPAESVLSVPSDNYYLSYYS